MVNFIEFPIFDGVSGDLRAWISWLEDFFVRERFTEDEKMNLAQSLLEGEANAWFYSSRKRFAFQSWEHLVVELLIWRFGDFGDFGVFSDPELFRLWDKYDRILQAQRVEKKRKRMSRTAITPQESISSSATIPETITVAKFSNPQVDEISAEKKESKQEVDLSMEKIASQLKLPNTTVHVSDSENLRNIETRIENSVLDNFESVVKEAKIQTNIRLDVVNGDDERIQRVMSSSKNVSAHQVLDKMCQLKRLKPKNKRKLSLSPKSRMFKFKNKMLQRNRSQMDPHHVVDSNIVTYISSSSRAKFGFKWKEHNSRYWGRMRQTRLYMRHKWKSKHLRAAVCLQNNPSYALAVVIKPVLECNTTVAISQLVLERSVSHDCFLGSLWEKKSVSWLGLACVLAECMMHTTTVISAKLYSLLSFEVDTEENISSGLSQTSQVWEPGGVLAEHVLVDWLVDFHDYAEIVEGIRCLVIGVCSGIQQPIDSRRASRVWERGGVDMSTALTDENDIMRLGWMVFDRGKNNIISGDVITPLMNAWYSCQQEETTSAESSSAVQRDEEVSVVHQQRIIADSVADTRVETVVVEESAISEPEAEAVVDVRFDDVDRGELLIKEQDHDASETSWMFSKAFVHLYPSFKLEDKLGLQGVSIDTFHHSHYGKNQKKIAWTANDVASSSK